MFGVSNSHDKDWQPYGERGDKDFKYVMSKKKTFSILSQRGNIKTKNTHNDTDYMSTYNSPGLSGSVFRHGKDNKSCSSQRSNYCGTGKYIFKIKNNGQSNSSQQALEYVIRKIFLLLLVVF